MMKRLLKPVAITVAILAALAFFYPMILTSKIPTQEPEEMERDAVQAAIDTFMTVNVLFEVTPSTSGVGGEKINGTGTQFHATLELQSYIRYLPSTYCYRWQRYGAIIFQYDANADGNCAIHSKQLFP